MNRSNLVKRAIVRAAVLASFLVAAIPNGYAQEKVRPEVGKPLQAAQDLMKTNKFIHMKDVLSSTRVHSLQDTQSNPRAISEGNVLWDGQRRPEQPFEPFERVE